MKYFALENLVGRADTNTSVGRCSNVRRFEQSSPLRSLHSVQSKGQATN